MARINLLGGTYLARGIIANAQTCLNLYPEKNPQDASAPYTNYLTPGLTLLGAPNVAGVARGLYTASNGSTYFVCGNNVYLLVLSPAFGLTLIGSINDNLTTPVGMNDNGNVLVIVNGTGVPNGGTGPGAGWAINLQSGIVGQPVAGVVTNAGTAGKGGSVSAGTITDAGSGAINGSYSNVAFTGGSGTGATATSVTVSNPIASITATTLLGIVEKINITTTVAHGIVGNASDQATITIAGVSGLGSQYVNGSQIVTVTSSTQFYITPPADIFILINTDFGSPTGGAVISGGTGEVTSVTPAGNGSGYDEGDTLGLNIAGLTGFTYTVSSFGIGVVNGSYTVNLNGGHGSGAQGNFDVAGGVVSDFTIVAGQGVNYLVGDILSTSLIPGLANFQLQLTVVGSALNAFASIVDPNFLGGTNAGVLDTFFVFNQPNTRNWYSSLSGITYGELTGTPGSPLFGTIIAAGTGGTAGTYNNVPLVNGSGTGATATIVVTNGVITGVALTDGGSGYSSAPLVSASGGGGSGAIILATINTSGQVTSLLLIAGGTGYSAPTLSFSGGGGSSATATAVATDGVVTAVTLDATGLTYNAGDVVIAQTTGVPTNFKYELVEVNAPAFDPTYVASKTGYPDLISTLIVVHREIWLLGSTVSTEVWYDAGGTSFPFAILPGVFIQHGCCAPYSVQTHDLSTFWLGIDEAGLATVFSGMGYEARRISTYAIEKALAGYLKTGTISDAIGMIYKQQDHIFYILTFPTANATWVYDISEGLWHERGWTDPNQGTINRIRANCTALVGNVNVCADWQNGDLYSFDLSNQTDNGGPITRRRGFPHLLNDGKRAEYKYFALDMECGNGISSDPQQAPLVTLEISDDRGRTFRVLPTQSFGAQGQYLVQPIWWRLGLARDRVFRVTWSDPAPTAIQGAWIDTEKSET